MTVDNHGFVLDQLNTDSANATNGMKFTTTTASTLTKVTKSSNGNPTVAQLRDSSFSLLDTQSFSGDDATFDYELSDATTYYVVATDPGATWDRSFRVASVSYPVGGTNVDWIAGRDGGADASGVAYVIQSITTSTQVDITVEPSEWNKWNL